MTAISFASQTHEMNKCIEDVKSFDKHGNYEWDSEAADAKVSGCIEEIETLSVTFVDRNVI